MMTLGISTHGPFAAWSTSRRGRGTFRFSVAYWLFGAWTLDLLFQVLKLSALALYFFGIVVLPVILKWSGIALASLIVAFVAAVSLWRGHRLNRKEGAR
jgi:hypothetical protein